MWRDRAVWPVLVLICVQTATTVVFVADMLAECAPRGLAALTDPANLAEILATVTLILGLGFEIAVLRRLVGRQRRMQRSLTAATGALAELMEGYFRTWGLTPTEVDVATFTIKGYSITEIAGFRGSAEGTIKTHLNAIYRKSGTSGRAQLVSVLVEDLFRGALVGGTGPAHP